MCGGGGSPGAGMLIDQRISVQCACARVMKAGIRVTGGILVRARVRAHAFQMMYQVSCPGLPEL